MYLQGSAAVEGVGPSGRHPVSEGRLCARGWSAHEAPRWGPRLRTPLVRRGGTLHPVSWGAALAAAVDSLAALREERRPLAVLSSGGVSNEESFLAVVLARAALGTGNVDAPLRAPYDALSFGSGLPGREGGADGALRELEHADAVLLLEGDLAAAYPRLALAVLRALRRGARLVTIGWSETRMSRLAGARLGFPRARPEEVLERLRAEVSVRVAQGAEERQTAPGPDDALARAAAWLVDAGRAAFVLGAFDGDPAVLARAAALVRSLGDVLEANGRATPLTIPLPVRANTRGSLEMGVTPGALPGRRPLADAAARERFRAVCGGDPCWERGLPFEEMLPDVAGLVVLGEDPLPAHPRPAEARAGLASLDTLVVLGSFVTETSRMARVVLPVASFGEANGTLTNLEGRVQRWIPWGPPEDGVRPAWEALRDLIRGLGTKFAPATLGDVFGAIRDVVPEYAALSPEARADPWGALLPPRSDLDAPRGDRRVGSEPPSGAGRGATTSEASLDVSGAPRARALLRREGVFDWGSDPLVRHSPTLSRTGSSSRKLHPGGEVAMSAEDAGALGVREGWTVRLRSTWGMVEAPVTLRAGMERGLLLVPFAFRGHFAHVWGEEGRAEVEVERP